MAEYKFYIQRADASENGVGPAIDLEEYFRGLKYRSCDGLETVGKVKNLETESYAEADGSRVWHPSDESVGATCESTTVILNLVFVGKERRTTLDLFRELAYSGRLLYWDTARLKKACLVLRDEQTAEKDTLKGLEYVDVKFKFVNVWGRAKGCLADGTVVGLIGITQDMTTGEIVATSNGDGIELDRLHLDQETGEIYAQ